MSSLRVILNEENMRTVKMSKLNQPIFYTDPMTYAAIFGYGTNPGKPMKGCKINYPLWGRQYAEIGTEGIITIPGSPSAPVKVVGIYTPLKWKLLMCSCPSGYMKVVFPNTDTPPSHGCILEFI